MILTHAVADWLLSSGVISESDIDGPADAAEGQIVLTREASEEFENGVRVGMLLQLLWYYHIIRLQFTKPSLKSIP